LNKIVNIVVDASGSMAEDDKNGVVKYLLNGINNIIETNLFDDVKFILYQWGQEIKKFENFEKAKIEFAGGSNSLGLEELKKLLSKDQTIIFISDGNFDPEYKVQLKDLSTNIITIFIGLDANRAILKDIATENVVYSVTDFVQVIFDACS
jgi:hypothetical protein